MSKDKIFADGFIARRNDNAPEYVLCNLSIKCDEAISFLQQHNNRGWVNIAVKRGKTGKVYCELDTYTPNRADVHDAGMAQARKAAEPKPAAPANDFIDDDIPF